MDGTDEDFYGVVEKEDDGIGLRAEKHATATLRLVTNLGSQWLMYGSICGGRDIDGGFVIYYRGIVNTPEGEAFGLWKVTFAGTGLETIAHQVAKHTRPSLRPGGTSSSSNPVRIESITVERLELEE